MMWWRLGGKQGGQHYRRRWEAAHFNSDGNLGQPETRRSRALGVMISRSFICTR